MTTVRVVSSAIRKNLRVVALRLAGSAQLDDARQASALAVAIAQQSGQWSGADAGIALVDAAREERARLR
jgi:hypothetical protein